MELTEKILLTVDEVIEATSLGRTTIFALMKTGELRAVKVGKRTFIRPADLAAFAESCTVRAARAA